MHNIEQVDVIIIVKKIFLSIVRERIANNLTNHKDKIIAYQQFKVRTFTVISSVIVRELLVTKV